MEKIPRDVIQKLALFMDLEDVVSLCSTFSKFNALICKNKIYWINRLAKDYNFTYDISLGDPKDLYTRTNKYFSTIGQKRNYLTPPYNVNDVLVQSLWDGDISVAKIALKNGADVDHTSLESIGEGEIPDTYFAATSGRGGLDVLKFVLDNSKLVLNDKRKILLLSNGTRSANMNIVKYIVEELKIKPNINVIREANSGLDDFEGDPIKYKERINILRYLKNQPSL